MIDVIESLLKGGKIYPAAFKRAKKFWDEFFLGHANDSLTDLQSAIESEQSSFQWAMEEVGLISPLAKDIMAITCVGSLYDDGFTNPALARRVVDAMRTSRLLSMGIGGSAEAVGGLYDL